MPFVVMIATVVVIFMVRSIAKAAEQTRHVKNCVRNLRLLASELVSGHIDRSTFNKRKVKILKAVVQSGAHTDEAWFMSQCARLRDGGFLDDADLEYLKRMSPTEILRRKYGGWQWVSFELF